MAETTEHFAGVVLDLLHESDVEDTVHSIAEHAKHSLACDFAGIMIVRNKRIETAAATDDIVALADKIQMQLGQGPCLEAIWEHDTFLVDDTQTEQRWRPFMIQVAELGMRSMLSIRLHASHQTLGALNLYSIPVRQFEDEDIALAHLFGQHASVALATALNEEGLRRAIDSRHLIGQAQGILMERFGISSSQAFAVLRRYSQDGNLKLRDVAEHLIDNRILPAAHAGAGEQRDGQNGGGASNGATRGASNGTPASASNGTSNGSSSDRVVATFADAVDQRIASGAELDGTGKHSL